MLLFMRQPFAFVQEHVHPERQKNKRQVYKERWWIHVEARPSMRDKLERLPRFIATARVSKHRLFTWVESPTLPDCQLIVFARSDDYFSGFFTPVRMRYGLDPRGRK